MASVWPWVSLVLGLLWLATLIAWWRGRRPASPVQAGPPAPPPGNHSVRMGAARKAFRQACHDNDAAAARRHLLEWASTVWPQDPPAGLNALARRLPDPTVSQLLRELDRACYAGGDWRGAALAQALPVLRDTPDPTMAKSTELPALYP
jgi:hypothetical protein